MLIRRIPRTVTWRPLAVAVLAMSSLVSAETLTYEHSGAGSGTLAGQPFGMSHFVITALVDTNNRQPDPDGWYIDHTSASIQIDGVGNFTFLSPTRTFVSIGGQMVGFSRAGVTGNDLFNGPFDPAFANWEMTTPIGPFTGVGGLLQWTLDPQIDTTGGTLIFDSATTDATFTALVPEPTGFLIAGALGLLLLRRR